jgi:hypothetical protein
MRYLVVFAAILLAVNCVEIYPPFSLLKTFYAVDPYTKGYCLYTGSGNIQNQAIGYGYLHSKDYYQAMYSCDYGKIELAYDPNNRTSMTALMISGNPASIVDLGTLSTIRNDNHIGSSVSLDSIFTSIHYDENTKRLVVASNYTKDEGLKFSPIVGIDDLYNTKDKLTFEPVSGHIYLLRLTSQPTSHWDNTVLFAKLIPVDKIPRPTLRWDVFFVDKQHGSNNDNDNNHRSSNLSKAEIAAISMSSGAVVFAIIGFIVAVTRNHQRRDYLAVS